MEKDPTSVCIVTKHSQPPAFFVRTSDNILERSLLRYVFLIEKGKGRKGGGLKLSTLLGNIR